jgi:hypothetical protein
MNNEVGQEEDLDQRPGLGGSSNVGVRPGEGVRPPPEASAP